MRTAIEQPVRPHRGSALLEMSLALAVLAPVGILCVGAGARAALSVQLGEFLESVAREASEAPADEWGEPVPGWESQAVARAVARAGIPGMEPEQVSLKWEDGLVEARVDGYRFSGVFGGGQWQGRARRPYLRRAGASQNWNHGADGPKGFVGLGR